MDRIRRAVIGYDVSTVERKEAAVIAAREMLLHLDVSAVHAGIGSDEHRIGHAMAELERPIGLQR